ncbi:hypothetical protein [Yinghuangia seranimata]|uniref:hypothetical protein n=1 Tax=Yinghuangia seranimata TaxID=408067 RepID=UPI00248AB67B|nr:hypothetical protein [Yinghuangia seranimata]MDI2130711.1 hypothetical protein [Yinghuangia seranimata]
MHHHRHLVRRAALLSGAVATVLAATACGSSQHEGFNAGAPPVGGGPTAAQSGGQGKPNADGVAPPQSPLAETQRTKTVTRDDIPVPGAAQVGAFVADVKAVDPVLVGGHHTTSWFASVGRDTCLAIANQGAEQVVTDTITLYTNDGVEPNHDQAERIIAAAHRSICPNL